MKTTLNQSWAASRPIRAQRIRVATNLVREIIENLSGQPGTLNQDQLDLIASASAVAGIVALRNRTTLFDEQQYVELLNEHLATTEMLLVRYLDGSPLRPREHCGE